MCELERFRFELCCEREEIIYDLVHIYGLTARLSWHTECTLDINLSAALFALHFSVKRTGLCRQDLRTRYL